MWCLFLSLVSWCVNRCCGHALKTISWPSNIVWALCLLNRPRLRLLFPQLGLVPALLSLASVQNRVVLCEWILDLLSFIYRLLLVLHVSHEKDTDLFIVLQLGRIWIFLRLDVPKTVPAIFFQQLFSLVELLDLFMLHLFVLLLLLSQDVWFFH